MLRLTLIAPLLLALAACGGTTNTPDYKSLIVGKWLWTEGGYQGATVEVFEDGNLRVTMSGKHEDQPQTYNGTYRLEGDTLKVDLKEPANDEFTHKIKRLDRQELVTEDEDGESNTFKRQ